MLLMAMDVQIAICITFMGLPTNFFCLYTSGPFFLFFITYFSGEPVSQLSSNFASLVGCIYIAYDPKIFVFSLLNAIVCDYNSAPLIEKLIGSTSCVFFKKKLVGSRGVVGGWAVKKDYK